MNAATATGTIFLSTARWTSPRWAGGWYLYALYNLLGVRENEWNLGFEPWLAEGMEVAELGDLLLQIFDIYSGKDDSQGEAPAPAATGAQGSCSADGESLKPILPENTTST